MKLFLTSGGVTNDELKRELQGLIGKSFGECVVAYIPTATLTDVGPHDWIGIAMKRFTDLGWKEFHYMDFNSLPKSKIAELLKKVDVLYCEGGNVYGLADAIQKHDLASLLMDALESRVYVGVSAGSMIFSKRLDGRSAQLFGEKEHLYADTATSPFNLFDWYLKPHLHSEYFPERTREWIEDTAKRADFEMYAITDDDAVKVVDGDVSIVGTGEWRIFNKGR